MFVHLQTLFRHCSFYRKFKARELNLEKRFLFMRLQFLFLQLYMKKHLHEIGPLNIFRGKQN